MVLLVLLAVFFHVACGQWAVTASSVENLNSSLAGVQPPVVTPPGVEMYLSPLSCLGALGPASAYGPLGSLGPVGQNSWNPSQFISGGLAFGWDEFAKLITGMGGPLSEDGPLGPSGPLGATYDTVLPQINDFANQLRGGGVWCSLGPLSAFGALGPLGPLGPIGAHGFKANANGQYVDKHGVVQRNVTVPYFPFVFPLFEMYTARFAKRALQDTSFGVYGSLPASSSVSRESYQFVSDCNQLLTVSVVPEYALQDFDLELYDAQGSLLAVSDSDGVQTSLGVQGFMDFVHLPVRRNQAFKVVVVARGNSVLTWALDRVYRLFVVGSTLMFNATRVDITGPHQKAL